MSTNTAAKNVSGTDVPSFLGRVERGAAGAVATLLISVALILVVLPPSRQVALPSCPNAGAGCVVSVDTDLTALSGALAAVGFVAALVAILGIRFTKIKAGGVEVDSSGYDAETAGLPKAEPQPHNPPSEPVKTGISSSPPERLPVRIDVVKGLGTQIGVVPVAITRLTAPMREIDPAFLRDYQSARRACQQSYFLTHLLGPPTQPDQKYSVALKVTPHREGAQQIRSTSFYLGRSWGNRVFPGQPGADGRFGIVTEAYGPFLALCEVEFVDGSRIVLDHYCDFDMGGLIPS